MTSCPPLIRPSGGTRLRARLLALPRLGLTLAALVLALGLVFPVAQPGRAWAQGQPESVARPNQGPSPEPVRTESVQDGPAQTESAGGDEPPKPEAKPEQKPDAKRQADEPAPMKMSAFDPTQPVSTLLADNSPPKFKKYIEIIGSEIRYQKEYATGIAQAMPIIGENLLKESVDLKRLINEILFLKSSSPDDLAVYRVAEDCLLQVKDRCRRISAASRSVRRDVTMFQQRLAILDNDLAWIAGSDKVTGERADPGVVTEAIGLRRQIEDLRSRMAEILRNTDKALEPVDAVGKALDEKIAVSQTELATLWRGWLLTPAPSVLTAESLRDFTDKPQSARSYGFLRHLFEKEELPKPWLLAAKTLTLFLILLVAFRGLRNAALGALGFARVRLATFSNVLAAAAVTLMICPFFTIFPLSESLRAVGELLFAFALATVTADVQCVVRSYIQHECEPTDSRNWRFLLLSLALAFGTSVGIHTFSPVSPQGASLIWTVGMLIQALLFHLISRMRWSGARVAGLFSWFVFPLMAALAAVGLHNLSMILLDGIFFFAVAMLLSLNLSTLLHSLIEKTAWPSPAKRTGFELTTPSVLLYLTSLMTIVWMSWRLGGKAVLHHVAAFQLKVDETTLRLSGLLIILALFFLVKTATATAGEVINVISKRRDAEGVLVLEPSLATLFSTITFYSAWVGFGFLTLFILGINMTNLAFIMGGLSVGIGFGMQNIINNFISGLIILLGRGIQPGDTLQIGDKLGIVTKVSIRNTMVQTLDNATLFIPNSNLVSQEVMNWSYKDRRIRQSIKTTLPTENDKQLVHRLLLEAATEDAAVLEDPKPFAVIREVNGGQITYELFFWLSDIKDAIDAPSRIYDAFDSKAKAAGIAFIQVWGMPPAEAETKEEGEADGDQAGEDDKNDPALEGADQGKGAAGDGQARGGAPQSPQGGAPKGQPQATAQATGTGPGGRPVGGMVLPGVNPPGPQGAGSAGGSGSGLSQALSSQPLPQSSVNLGQQVRPRGQEGQAGQAGQKKDGHEHQGQPGTPGQPGGEPYSGG